MQGRTRPRTNKVIRRYHLNVAGVIYALTSVFIAVGALNSQNNLLFLCFGLAVGGLLVSGVVSGSALMGIEAERELPRTPTAGERSIVRYTLTNRNRLMPSFALRVGEVRAPKGLGATPALVEHVGARQRVEAIAPLLPSERGRHELSRIVVSSSFPFGLMRKSVLFERPASILVRPRLLPLRAGLIRELASIGHAGTVATQRAGRGDEFFSVREYYPGDPPRNVAWRRSARTGDLVVRELAAPAPRRVWLRLAPLDDATRTDVETAVSLASSLAVAANRAGYAVGLMTSEGLGVSPALGSVHVGRLQDLLAVYQAGERTTSGMRSPPAPGDGVIEIGAGPSAHGVQRLDVTKPDTFLVRDARLEFEDRTAKARRLVPFRRPERKRVSA